MLQRLNSFTHVLGVISQPGVSTDLKVQAAAN